MKDDTKSFWKMWKDMDTFSKILWYPFRPILREGFEIGFTYGALYTIKFNSFKSRKYKELVEKEFRLLEEDNAKGKLPGIAFKQAKTNILHIIKEVKWL